MQRVAENLHRPTPIPSLDSGLGSRRASGALSVGSIAEEDEVEEHDSATSLVDKSAERAAGRQAVKSGRLSPIPSGKQARAAGRRGSSGGDRAGQEAALRGLQQRSGGSDGPPSPVASESSASEGSGATLRSLDCLHRPTPIPQEASASHARPGSFSKRGSRALPTPPTIDESGEREEWAEAGAAGSPRASLASQASLHRPTPIPSDLLSSGGSLGGRSQGARGGPPTIREDEPCPPAGPLPDEQDSSEHHYGSRRSNGGRSPSPTPARSGGRSKAGSDVSGASSPREQAGAGGRPPALAPLVVGPPAPLSPGFQPFVDSKDWERDIVGVARFLRMCPGLSRQVIGDLLGENNERCLRVLECFTASFDFTGLAFEAALREYLESFRLPGEAQKIYRILDAWSRQFFQQCPGFFQSADAVHVLAFSLVLLNTDHHKSSVKRKMTCAQFVHNNRGINAGGDFPRAFLEELFRNIERRAIRIPAAGPPDALSPTNSLPEPMRTAQKMYKAEEKPRPGCFCF